MHCGYLRDMMRIDSSSLTNILQYADSFFFLLLIFALLNLYTVSQTVIKILIHMRILEKYFAVIKIWHGDKLRSHSAHSEALMGIHLRGKYRHDVNEECIKKKNVYNGLEVTFMNKHFPQCMGPLALMAIKKWEKWSRGFIFITSNHNYTFFIHALYIHNRCSFSACPVTWSEALCNEQIIINNNSKLHLYSA